METQFNSRVRREWLDYNGHMNLAYYSLVFDQAGELFLSSAGLDAARAEANGDSWMVAEAHLTYQQEALPDAALRVKTRILALDSKRLHLFQQMYLSDGDVLLATNEQLILHVNLTTRRVSPFTNTILSELKKCRKLQQHLDPPDESGRAISLANHRPNV